METLTTETTENQSTGVPEIQSSSTPVLRSIPLDKITPSPFQARKKFDEASIQELAETLKERGLRNAINVRPVDDHFELVAGERRWRAAKLLGWQTIEAKVEPADDKEAALRGLIENVQREDLSAIEQAQGYKRLSEPPFSLNQSQIGRMVGKDQTLVNKYFAVSKLCDHPGGMNAFIPLGLGHLLELCRLTNPEDQAALADETAKRGLSATELKALVDKKGGKAKAKPQKTPTNVSSQTDPLAALWPAAKHEPDISNNGSWEVSYSPQKGPKGAKFYGWTLKVVTMGINPAQELGQWLHALGDAVLKATPTNADTPPMGRPPIAMPDIPKAVQQAMPSNEAEFKQMEEDQKNLRLPKTPEEQTELETLASQGPAAVYAWVYGPNSLMAKKMQSATWADLDMSDPVAGCRKMIDGLRQVADLMASK